MKIFEAIEFLREKTRKVIARNERELARLKGRLAELDALLSPKVHQLGEQAPDDWETVGRTRHAAAIRARLAVAERLTRSDAPSGDRNG